MAGDGKQSLVETFRTQLYDTLRRRAPGDLHFVVALKEEPAMFRPFLLPEDAGDFEGFPFRELYFCSTAGFSRIVPFSQVLSRAFHGMPGCSGIDGWRQVTVWFAAAEGCRYARRLLDQLEAPGDEELRLDNLPADFRGKFSDCLRDAGGVRSLAREFGESCVQALRHRRAPAGSREEPGFIKFVPKRRSVEVEWIADDPQGTVLWRETLKQFAEAMTEEADWHRIAGELERIAGSRQGHAEAGRSILQAVSPRVAEAAETACSRNHAIGLRLATACVRTSIPLSVWLFIDPTPEWSELAEVTITANRAHEEFVMQGGPPGYGLFYFPPTVLVAKLGVRNNELHNDHFPTVLVPKGGPMWLHPYTGGLRKTSFTEAILLDGDEPAYTAPSPEARNLWPYLLDKTKSPLENDICLSGQKATVDALFQTFNARAQDGAPDVLSLVNALHGVVRMGLTRAHCNNQSAPRTSIRETLYPLRGRPPRWIAHRVFSYNPDKPV